MSASSPRLIDYFVEYGFQSEICNKEGVAYSRSNLVTHLELIVIPDELRAKLQNSPDEKWIPLDNSNVVLRVCYGGEKRPITSINLYRITVDNQQRLRIPKSYELEPLTIRKHNEQPLFKKKHRKTATSDDLVYYGRFDLSEFIECQDDRSESRSTILVFMYKREQDAPPITKIVMRSKEQYEAQFKNLNRLEFMFGAEKDRCLLYETRDILKKKFEPKQITRYPTSDHEDYPLMAPAWTSCPSCFPMER